MTWRTYLIWYTEQCCFLFSFVYIKLVSVICFLQIWVPIYVYSTKINWSTLIKKLMQTYIVIVSGSILNVSTVHLNGIWHLIWRYLSKPVLGGCYSIPRWCPFNTRFTILSVPRTIGVTSKRLAFYNPWLERLAQSRLLMGILPKEVLK